MDGAVAPEEEEEDEFESLCLLRPVQAESFRNRRRLDVEALERAGCVPAAFPARSNVALTRWRSDSATVEDAYAQSEAKAQEQKRAAEMAAQAAEAATIAERERARTAAADAAEEDEATSQPTSNKGARSKLAQRRKVGSQMTFNEREKRSRTMRGENDWNQEQKRILRQQTDGFCMGY